MIDVTRSVEVPATPDEVAALVMDLGRWPDWFALHDGWASDAPTRAEVGVTFKQRVKVLGIPGDVTWEVVEVELPSRVVLKGRGTSRTSMEVDFHIDEHSAGAEVSFTAKMSGLALRPLKGKLQPWVEERTDRSLAALVKLLEQGA